MVLSQGDTRDYGVLRVISKTPNTVTFNYELINTADSGATLISGDPYQGGYDFSTQTYLGLSRGDLYFVDGAFWANNYDERGVADLGPCPTVDSVAVPPKVAHSRFNVTAVVGHCYSSPLHWDNRAEVLFRVDALTATTVTLTWHLLPVPVNQLVWQHCEPWHRPTAPAPTTTAAVLSAWLAQNPYLADTMQWITPVEQTPPATVGYNAWPANMQALLLQNFVDYWAWYAAGMNGPDPTPVTDPPPNQYVTSGGNVMTVLTQSDAQALYVKYVALSLVVELQGQVPWSLFEFDAAGQAELLDSRKFFTQFANGGYELIPLSVIPAPPLMTATHLRQHGLLCQNRVESIAEAVFWARHLQHYQNTSNPAQDELDFWQYAGNPPASRMLSGTTYTGMDGAPTNLTQWTAGCHGTTGLLKAMLRTINIPVEEFTGLNPSVSHPNNALYLSGHATPHFLSEHLWLSHGDDPYIGFANNMQLPFPLSAMEIDDSQFLSWFPDNGASPSPPLGRQRNELWVDYGDQALLEEHLKDLQTQPVPADKNLCADTTWAASPPNNYYTCAQAESAGLLSMLDPLVTPYLSSGSLDSDLRNVPFYMFPEPQFLAAPCDTCVPAACAQNAACCTSWDAACQSVAYQICGTACIY